MSWPASDLTTVHLDQTTDDPSQARVEIKNAVDKINSIIDNAVTASTASTVVLRTSDGDAQSRAFISTATTGTAPLTVSSITKVANLNADKVDGYDFNQALQTTDSPTFAGLTVGGASPLTINTSQLVILEAASSAPTIPSSVWTTIPNTYEAIDLAGIATGAVITLSVGYWYLSVDARLDLAPSASDYAWQFRVYETTFGYIPFYAGPFRPADYTDGLKDEHFHTGGIMRVTIAGNYALQLYQSSSVTQNLGANQELQISLFKLG